MVNKKLN